MRSSRKSRLACGIALATTVSVVLAMTSSPASAHKDRFKHHKKHNDSSLARQLVKKADGPDANRHLIALQRIADRNGGNRASGTPGYDASVEYVAGLLRKSGYEVSTPAFTYDERVAANGTLTVGGQTSPRGCSRRARHRPQAASRRRWWCSPRTPPPAARRPTSWVTSRAGRWSSVVAAARS